MDERIHLTELPRERFSFPSGHAVHAVSFSLIASACFPVLGWPLWAVTFCVALSRRVLGLHYISDVVVGALLGAGMGYATVTIMVHMGMAT